MDEDALFAIYYVLYRTEADTPNDSDDEYVIFDLLTREAIQRWSNYDATFWRELYNTLQVAQDGDLVIGTNQTEYATPSDMRKAGGFLHLTNDQGVTMQRIPIVEPNQAQFLDDLASYCYFIGDPNNGFTMILNPTPTSEMVGLNMNYVYYSIPDLFTTGTDVPQMTQPMFIVHRCLANRFRGSRNPYYTSAKNDAEDILKTMQAENNSGNWADPWKLADNSGATWGRDNSTQGIL